MVELDKQADQIAARINRMIGRDSCQWCPYSRAFFTTLPVDMKQVADKVAEAFRKTGYDVETGRFAGRNDTIQVTAYPD